MALKTVVIYGSVRDNRQGIRAANYIANQLKVRKHEVTFIDPLELDVPFMKLMYKEYQKGKAPEWMEKLATTYKAADAFVLVTGEYNHSIPPPLSNLLSFFLDEYFYRPAAIVSYSAGIVGGQRAAVHLRALAAELGMPTIPSMLAIPEVSKACTEDGALTEPGARIQKNFDKFAVELEWYANALHEFRQKSPPLG
jgi:NAD(P)H-dependent FMN reductase